MNKPDGRLAARYASGPMTIGRETVAEIIDMLTVILGGVEQLRQQPLDERGVRQVERMEQAAQRMAQLVSSLADASTSGA